MKPKKNKTKKTKSVKVFEDTHLKLKIHVAKNKANITEFVSSTIEERIKQGK